MTPETAAQFWEELQRALRQVQYLRQPPAWRRRRTGEMRITFTERRAMQAFHLLNGENYSQLGRRFRRKGQEVPRVIWEPVYREFHRYYWGTDAGHRLNETRGRKSARVDETRSAA